MAETPEIHDGVEEPADVLRNLLDEWEARAAEHDERAAEAEGTEEARRHRGRKEALQQGIRRLEAKDIEADPFRAAGQVSGRLHNRMGELGRLISEGAPLETKHRAIRTELSEMRGELDEAREQLHELLDEDQLPHPDDWMWVNEEVRERLLEAWGYDE